MLAEVDADDVTGLAPELVEQLARALRVPEGSAVALIEESRALVHEHPRTLAALRGGHISHAHAQTILGYTDGLRRANRVALETRLLKHARTTTPGELSLVARVERERRLRPERPTVEPGYAPAAGRQASVAQRFPHRSSHAVNGSSARGACCGLPPAPGGAWLSHMAPAHAAGCVGLPQPGLSPTRVPPGCGWAWPPASWSEPYWDQLLARTDPPGCCSAVPSRTVVGGYGGVGVVRGRVPLGRRIGLGRLGSAPARAVRTRSAPTRCRGLVLSRPGGVGSGRAGAVSASWACAAGLAGAP